MYIYSYCKQTHTYVHINIAHISYMVYCRPLLDAIASIQTSSQNPLIIVWDLGLNESQQNHV